MLDTTSAAVAKMAPDIEQEKERAFKSGSIFGQGTRKFR
jgi:hypothetical protein